MTEIEKLLENNNKLLTAVLHELKEINSHGNKDVITVSPSRALEILGLNNTRYLTYFCKENLISRRKGGSGFVYYKDECIRLAGMIKSQKVPVPDLRSIYSKGEAHA